MSDAMLMTAPVAAERGMLRAEEVVARARRIQEVMKALMKDGTHYGTIPGTPKPTLYKAGSELILMTFRIAAVPGEIVDLSTPDEVRYRVTMRGIAQGSGELLGEAAGECSSNELKYKWRRPVCDQEWQEAPEDQRREVWQRSSNGPFKAKQIRTSPADVANTILKMAMKRAQIAMTLVATACSDIFAQDLEDLPEGVRESVAGTDTHEPAPARTQPPQRKSAQGAAPASTATSTGATHVVDVTTKSGESNGKAWTIWRVKLSDGREATTFHEGIGLTAQALKQSGAPCEMSTEPGKKAGSLNIVELVAVEREPGSDDA